MSRSPKWKHVFIYGKGAEELVPISILARDYTYGGTLIAHPLKLRVSTYGIPSKCLLWGL